MISISATYNLPVNIDLKPEHIRQIINHPDSNEYIVAKLLSQFNKSFVEGLSDYKSLSSKYAKFGNKFSIRENRIFVEFEDYHKGLVDMNVRDLTKFEVDIYRSQKGDLEDMIKFLFGKGFLE